MSIPALRSFPAVYGVKLTARLVRHHSRLGGELRASSVAVNGEVGLRNRSGKKENAVKEKEDRGLEPLYDDGFGGVTVKDYFAAARALCKDDGGPPRWFSPVESGQPAVEDAPLLLFLPGTDGVGMGLILHHKSLGKAFEVRCLHIPVNDRTPFEENCLTRKRERPKHQFISSTVGRNMPIKTTLKTKDPISGTPYKSAPISGNPFKLLGANLHRLLALHLL